MHDIFQHTMPKLIHVHKTRIVKTGSDTNVHFNPYRAIAHIATWRGAVVCLFVTTMNPAKTDEPIAPIAANIHTYYY